MPDIAQAGKPGSRKAGKPESHITEIRQQPSGLQAFQPPNNRFDTGKVFHPGTGEFLTPIQILYVNKQPQGMKRLGILHPTLDAAKIGARMGDLHNGKVFDIGFHDLGAMGF
jgi:hypothetical protein